MSELKKVIRMYDVPLIEGRQRIDLPFESEIVHVAIRDPDKVTFWAEVYLHDGVPRARMNGADFIIVPTGGPIPLFTKHVGSVLTGNGAFAWHLYRFDDR